MTLATHAVIGASLAAAIPLTHNHPIEFIALAFVAGILSHFMLDVVPHWDYELGSDTKAPNPADFDLKIGRAFIFDLGKIGLDVGLGLVIALLLYVGLAGRSSLIILAGAIGAVLPDFLQFVYMKIRRPPFTWFQHIHDFYHYDKKAFKKYGALEGASLQLFFAGLVIVSTLSLIFFHL